MGGNGSGRKPRKRPVEELIEDNVAAARKEAAKLPKRDYAAEYARRKKGGDDKPEKAEKADAPTRKARKSRYPKPEEFKDNPLAQAFNAFADAKAHVKPGTAAACQLGESYMAVLDYYTGGVVDHPLAVCLVSTGSFAAVAYAANMGRKVADGTRKGPESPAGQAIGPTAMDALCECGALFPSTELRDAHRKTVECAVHYKPPETA